MVEKDDRPIAHVDELCRVFEAASKPRSRWRIGAEHEKIGVVAATGMPAPYEGVIEPLLRRLSERGGWDAVREGDRLIGLARGAERVSLEPGGQMELSGAPLPTLAEVDAEITGHLAEIGPPSEELGVAWLGVGFRPFGTIDDVPWVPKGRYAVMRAYLPSRGRLAHEMMKRTATVQANVDWSDEEDAARKLRASMSVTSIVTALFASSPLRDGKDSGYASYRARAWLETDPDRCGLLPFAFAGGSLFRHYVEWALDVPMFFVYRGAYRPAGGMTFRRFLREGFQGERATMADWELHISTLFPEARLRHYLELRGADAGPLPMVLALPALWKGLLYDDAACAAATALTADLDFGQRLALREAVPREGLAARAGRRTVHDLARELVAIARAGLPAPERPYLDPLDEIVSTGRTHADRLRALFHADPTRIIPSLKY